MKASKIRQQILYSIFKQHTLLLGVEITLQISAKLLYERCLKYLDGREHIRAKNLTNKKCAQEGEAAIHCKQ